LSEVLPQTLKPWMPDLDNQECWVMLHLQNWQL